MLPPYPDRSYLHAKKSIPLSSLIKYGENFSEFINFQRRGVSAAFIW